MKIRLVNPFSGVFGPIFQKEVRASGRRRGTYVLRALYAAGLLGLVGVAFWGIQMERAYESAIQRIQNLQQLAPGMTMVIMWFQLIAMALIAPMLAAPAICDERRARSLATLLTTPLTSGQIILGKLSSRMVQLAILALLTMPVLLAIRVFGGLNAEIVLAFTCVSLSVGVLAAALALMYSIWHSRATSAALFALLTLVLVQAAPSAVEGILYFVLNEYGLTSSTYEFHPQVLVTAAPYSLVGMSGHLMTGGELPWLEVYWPWLYRLTSSAGMTAAGYVRIAPIWVCNVAYNLGIAAVTVAISVAAMRRLMVREAGESARSGETRPKRRSKGVPAEEQLDAVPEASRADERIFESAADEPTRDRASSRVVSDRPVLWRELRRSAIRSRSMRIGIALVAVGGIAVLYATAGIGDEGLQMTFAVLAGLVVMIQAIFMTTGSIAAEREGRTWEVLLTTPMSGREIVLSKFLGAWRAQWFIPAVLLIHFSISAALEVLPWIFVAQLVLILLGPMLFFTASGQFLSLAFRRGLTGSVLNLILGLFIWLGLWIVLGLVGWFGEFVDHEWWEEATKFPYSLNPPLMAGSACSPAVRTQFAQGLTYDMLDSDVSSLEFNAWVVAAFSVYAGLAAAILVTTIASFRRLSGRSS